MPTGVLKSRVIDRKQRQNSVIIKVRGLRLVAFAGT